MIPISKDPFLIEFVAKTAHFGSVRGEKGKREFLSPTLLGIPAKEKC